MSILFIGRQNYALLAGRVDWLLKFEKILQHTKEGVCFLKTTQ